MRHLVFVEAGRLEWREVVDPMIQGPGEALIRPIVAGRCDLDVAYVTGLAPLASGEPIGHEIIGEIVDLGEDAARKWHIGQQVFVPAQISCGVCSACRRGATGRCQSVPFGASYGMGRAGGFGGGVADLVRVPFADGMLSALPPVKDPAQLIGASDMATDAWRAVAPQLRERPGGTVLVISGLPGTIGLYAAGLAVSLGAGDVAYSDPDHRRRDLARSYGARVSETPEDLGDGPFDIVVVALPFAAALEHAFRVVAPAGAVTSVTYAVDASPNVDTGALYQKGVRWDIGRPDCRVGRDGALHAWGACGFRPDHVPTEIHAWDAAPDAWTSDALYVAVQRAPLHAPTVP